jgi:virginiamycin B lyase
MVLLKLVMRIAGHYVVSWGSVRALSFACGVVLLTLFGSHAWAQITEFELPNPNSGPGAILIGPDGNLWFVENGLAFGNNVNRIGRFNLANSTIDIEFEFPNPQNDLRVMTVGPDGNFWFAEFIGNRIGTMTLDGHLTEFELPNPNSGPQGITLGPDGNLWFTENLGNRIGMITPQGDILEFSIPAADSSPRQITAGPDGNLWFTEHDGNQIGRITPSGQITEFPLSADSGPIGITAGPDSNVWFTAYGGNWIGRITPNGDVTRFDIPTLNSTPIRITTGPDGNLWFTEDDGNRIGQITAGGVITELPEWKIPTPESDLLSITTGPDGNMWFTEDKGNKIGRLIVPAQHSSFRITAPASAVSGTAFDVTIAALDPYGNTIVNYQGTVTFSTTDPDSGAVLPADYTFTIGDGADNGAHTFSGGVTLVTVGTQTLTVTDSVSGMSGSITITVGPGP